MKYAMLALLFVTTSALAVVNPDAPNYVGKFQQRIDTIRQRAFDDADTTLAMDQASKKLAQALDDELNAAYKKLTAQLPAKSRDVLRASQRRWLKYRDAEFAFLSQTFTREQFGSSAVLNAASARNAIVQDRAEQLWSYLERL